MLFRSPVNKDNGFTSKVILAATYFVVIILVVFIYLLIAGKTKKKHEDGLKNIRQLRERIQGNNRQVRKITRAIRKIITKKFMNLVILMPELKRLKMKSSV